MLGNASEVCFDALSIGYRNGQDKVFEDTPTTGPVEGTVVRRCVADGSSVTDL